MYKIVGADNQEYGPVTKEEILQWIAQGRANARTLAKFEDGAWKPLATFDEFKEALNIPAAGAAPAGSFASIPSTGSEKKSNGAAIAGLVFGILGLICCCPYLGPILAIIFGVIGQGQIKANPHLYSTDASLPKIAIVLGIIGLLLQIGLSIFSTALQAFLLGISESMK